MMRRLSPLALLFALTAWPSPAGAQDRVVDRSEFYLGLNMLIGGVSAAAQSFLTSSSATPREAFLKGALGGAVTHGGQRMVATGEAVLRLPGVQVAALGSNIARNAARGTAAFSELLFPLPPFYLRVRPGQNHPISVRLSGVGLVTIGLAAMSADRHQARLDWKETLLTGAPVFRSISSWIYPFEAAPGDACLHGDGCAGAAAGMHRGGITWYTTGGRSAAQSRHILTHEVLHLTQVNRDVILHAAPMSDGVLGYIGGPFARAADLLVIDAYLPITALNQLFAATVRSPTGPLRLYELEVEALTKRGH